MAGKAAIILGHSHLSSIVYYLNDRPAELYEGDASIQYYVFDTVRMGADFQFTVSDNNGGYILNPVIHQMVEERVPADRERIYISMFGGNAHNALTLLEHPKPFDFTLPSQADLPIEPDCDLVTSGYIRDFLLKMSEVYRFNTSTLRNAVREPVVHFESPPPIGSNAFILDRLEAWFKNEERPPKIAPKYLRYKLWRMHSEIIKESCERGGVEFLETPAGAFDDEGFLLEEHARDSTHADASFGRLVLKNFEHRRGLQYSGWLWL